MVGKLLLGLGLAAVASAASAETITIRADVWCPFNCDPASPDPGFMVEVAKAALEPAGHKVEYAALNWARAITDTRAGTYSAIVGAAHTDAPDFVFPATAIGSIHNCFFVKPDSTFVYKGLESLGSIAVGVAKDYSYDADFDAYIAANAKDPKKVDVVSGDKPLELNLKKVAAGRIGAFVEDESVLKSYLFRNKMPADTVKNAGCIVGKDNDLFVAFGPKLPKAAEYAKLVGDKMDAMRKDGSLATLLKKYGIEDWKK
jgi:polar amino acid transport system substrate-binding protein